MVDWNAIAAWAGGITTVLASVAAAIWLALTRAMQVAKTLPAPVTKTDVITTDTIAYEQLGRTIEGNTLELVQTNRLLAEIVTVGADFTSMMREEREEREFEEEVEKRVKDRLQEQSRRARSKSATPAPRRRAPKSEAS